MRVSGAVSPAPAGADRDRRGTRLTGLTWAHFLNDGAANYLPGILPAVLISLHEPVQMAGVLMAALTIGQALQPLMGWIADRVGGRSLIVSGLLASSLGGAFLGMTHSLWVLLVLLVLIGVGSSLFHPQALAAVRSMITSRQGLITAAFLVGGELGRGVWPTAASLIGVTMGLQSLWIVSLPALITIPFLLRWAPRLPARRRQAHRIRWREHVRPLSLLIGYRGIRAFSVFGMVTFIPVMWHIRGGTLVSGASIITTMIVVGVIGNLGGGQLADRFGRTPVLVVSGFATAALIPAVVYSAGAWIWITAALLGIAMFLSASTTILIGQDIFPENRSMGSGVALGLANGIGALLILAIGFLISDRDVYTVFWIMTVAGLIAAVFPLGLPRALVRR